MRFSLFFSWGAHFCPIFSWDVHFSLPSPQEKKWLKSFFLLIYFLFFEPSPIYFIYSLFIYNPTNQRILTLDASKYWLVLSPFRLPVCISMRKSGFCIYILGIFGEDIRFFLNCKIWLCACIADTLWYIHTWSHIVKIITKYFVTCT